MKITAEITDYSNTVKPNIKIHNASFDGNKVDLEVKGERYTVSGMELISAVKKCMLDCFGR